MNQVILEGRIVSELKKKSEKAPCEFRVETRDEWRGEKVEGKNNNQYHAVVVWGEKGNWVHQNLKRNDLVRLEGFYSIKLWNLTLRMTKEILLWTRQEIW